MKPKGKLKFSEYIKVIGSYGDKYLKSQYVELYDFIPKVIFSRDIQMNQYIKYKKEANK